MSPLTKLFVVLLVVLALLNAAGEVVFVNKVSQLQPILDQQKLATAQADDIKNAAIVHMNTVQTELTAEIKSHHDEVTLIQGVLNSTRAQVNDDQVKQAVMEKQNADILASNAGLSSGTEVQATVVSTLQAQNAAMRDRIDAQIRRVEDDNRRITELAAAVDTFREREENLQAQLTENKDMIARLSTFLNSLGPGIYQKAIAGPAVTASLDIRGRVTESQVIANNTYVTIDVGSADGVTMGATLFICDGPNFLGQVTIEKVNSKDAVGKVDGLPDSLAKIHPGAEVLSKLRS